MMTVKTKINCRVKLRVFLLGMREFKTTQTTHFGPEFINVYDWGREIAHRLTLRRFEDC
jgi:hypothetical protein